MRILKHFKTLVYYDEPQLFVARDQLEISYACLLVGKTDSSDKYLCAPISKGRLNDFTSGEIDLLSLIKSSETGEVFVGTAANGNLDSIPTEQISESKVSSEWLPEPGFFLKPEPATNIEVLEESRERQRAIIHCSLNPPEARQDSKISAERLGQAVRLVQRVVSHAFRRALRDLDANTRKAVDLPENYELEVFAFSPGSFTLHMQTTAMANMFGYSQIEKALSILDRINDQIDDPEATVQTVSTFGGHLATAYKDLVQFIADTKTPLSYEWSMPERKDSTKRRITDKQAEPIYLALLERSDIGKEEKRITGTLKKADVDRGTWGLLSDIDNKHYSGRSERGDVELTGLVLDARYEFLCEEQLSEERGTGKESTILYLKSHRSL